MAKLSYYLLAFGFSICLSNNVTAQFSLGAEGGWAKNYLASSTANLVSTKIDPANGFAAGIAVLYRFNDWLAVVADPNYAQKNWRISRTDFYTGVYQHNNFNYLQLPLAARFSIGAKKVKGFADMGVFAGYWLSGKISGTEPNILNSPSYSANNTNNNAPDNVFNEYTAYSYAEKYAFDNTKDNRLEWGLNTGIGISYQVKGCLQVFAETKYYRALSDQQKKYETNQIPRYNDTYVFQMGALFNLKKKHVFHTSKTLQ